MKITFLDSAELDESGSEQFMTIFSAKQSKSINSILDFIKATNNKSRQFYTPVIEPLPEPKPLYKCDESVWLINTLKSHCNIVLIPHDTTAYSCKNNWDIKDFLVEFEYTYFRIVWSTTA